jgi:hypothetical protein
MPDIRNKANDDAQCMQNALLGFCTGHVARTALMHRCTSLTGAYPATGRDYARQAAPWGLQQARRFELAGQRLAVRPADSHSEPAAPRALRTGTLAAARGLLVQPKHQDITTLGVYRLPHLSHGKQTVRLAEIASSAGSASRQTHTKLQIR